MALYSQDVTVELELDGVWTDVTSYVRLNDGIAITRGRQDEASVASPAKCSLRFNNSDGRFSPRNPTGAYYGSLGRNTPIRVSVDAGQTRLKVGAASAGATAPDTAGLSITGDIDLRADISMPSWIDNTDGGVISKFVGGQQSYRLLVEEDGRISINWSTDGSNSLFMSSLVPVPNTTGRQAIRATLDVNNGAGGKTATFYTADTMDGTWAQLGDAVTEAGTTSIFNGTSSVLAASSAAPFSNLTIFKLEIRQGIAGPVFGNPDFTAQAEGATSVTDGAGNVWTVAGDSSVTKRYPRFIGEVSEWPVGWNLAESDVTVSVQASGVRRRLIQGDSPLRSAFYRGATSTLTSLLAYWPMEDAAGSTSLASGVPGGSPMFIIGSPQLATDDTFDASAPLPHLNGAAVGGSVPSYTGTGEVLVRFLTKVNSGTPGGTVIARIYTPGALFRWDLLYAAASDGDLILALYDAVGTLLGVSPTHNFNIDDTPVRMGVRLIQNGGNIDAYVETMVPGSEVGLVSAAWSNAGTLGNVVAVHLGASFEITDEPIGHLTVQSDVTSIYDLRSVLDGYAEETAGARISRLCTEESVEFVTLGAAADSAELGPQGIDKFVSLVDQASAADVGALTERHDELGLAFRTRESLYNRRPAVTVGYNRLIGVQPTDDDQLVRNDITVSRIDGSAVRATLESGALSVLAPPDGVGRYDEQVELSLFSDTQLADQANWRLHLGTFDAPRYPSVAFDLASLSAAFTDAEKSAVLGMVEGDLIVITDPPTFAGPPDDIHASALGWTETISAASHVFEFTTAPADTYRVWTIGSQSLGRLDSETTVTNESLDTTETGVDFTGDTWITSSARPGDFPFDIMVGGEVMRVTAATSTTFTVTRSVNGVVKSHASGAPIRLYRQPVIAL